MASVFSAILTVLAVAMVRPMLIAGIVRAPTSAGSALANALICITQMEIPAVPAIHSVLMAAVVRQQMTVPGSVSFISSALLVLLNVRSICILMQAASASHAMRSATVLWAVQDHLQATASLVSS
jgi:hypothetical protein